MRIGLAVSSLEHALNSLDTRLKDRQEERTDHLARRESLGKHLDQPFEYEEQLRAATTRQQEILSALDLTKNQAATTVDEGPEQNTNIVEEKPNQVIQKRNGVSGAVRP